MVAMATFSLLWLYLTNIQVSVNRTICPLVSGCRDDEQEKNVTL